MSINETLYVHGFFGRILLSSFQLVDVVAKTKLSVSIVAPTIHLVSPALTVSNGYTSLTSPFSRTAMELV